MVCTYIARFVSEKDGNGDKIGDWCEQAEKGYFKCKWCMPGKTLSLKQGKSEVLKHAITSKHRESKVTFKQKHQPRIDDMFKEKDEVDTSASDLEIIISMALARHSVPFTFADCLSDTFKKYVTDSEV